MKLSRGKFLKVVTAGVAGVPLVNAGRIAEVGSAKAPLTLGMASYTLRSFSLDEVIEMLVRLEIKHVALKSMHLPLDASDKDIQSMAMRVRDAGIDLYGVGVIYIKSEQELENDVDARLILIGNRRVHAFTQELYGHGLRSG